jgi:hypothetical protein
MNTIQMLAGNAQAKKAALAVQTTALNTYEVILNSWCLAMDTIWAGPDPVGCVAELGNTAAKMFALSQAFCVLLEELSPGCTAERLQLMAAWDVSLHVDGTATVVRRTPQPELTLGNGESAG